MSVRKIEFEIQKLVLLHIAASLPRWTKSVHFAVLLMFCILPKSVLATPISDLLDGVKLSPTIHSIPLSGIRDTRMIDGILYTVGYGDDGPAMAHRQDMSTGESQSIPLRNLTDSGLGDGIATGMAKVGEEIFFVGFGRISMEPGGIAGMIWDSEGNPTQAPYLPDFVDSTGFVFDITSDGFMSGSQTSVAVMWNSVGDVFELPRTELSNALGMGSTGLAMTDDASIIVGGIGTGAAVWEAVGDPMNGEYALKEYGFNDVFPFTMEQGIDGFTPESAQFVLDTDAFGTMMFANYSSPEGLRSGVWSVEDGSFLRDFGFGRVQDVFVDGDGNIIVATNDEQFAQSGLLWSFTDSDPLALHDLFGQYDYQDIYFTRGGLYEGSLGMLLNATLNGQEVSFLASYYLSGENGPGIPPGEPIPEPPPYLLLAAGIPLLRRRRKGASGSPSDG